MIKNALVCILVLAFTSSCFAKQSADPIAFARVFTWEDINSNGKPDTEEPPIPFITTRLALPDILTDLDGWATVSSPAADCAPNCWDGETVSVKVPPGYTPTTPTNYAFSARDDTYYFGFHAINPNDALLFPNEPVWQKALINRGTKVLAFEYSPNGNLAITIDRDGTVLDDYYPKEYLADEYYYDIFLFNVILELADFHSVSISEVRITFLPSSNVFVCSKSELDTWQGQISGYELLTQNCIRLNE